MIQCSVCGTQNDDLAVICVSCKSYLQTKVDTLNLFETMWRLFETPGPTFKKIVLAQHKNYVFLLSSLLGVTLTYTIIWYKNLGSIFSNILTIIGAGLLIGPALGILFAFLFSLVMRRIALMLGGKANLRNTFAIVSYASVPLVISLFVVFPVEVAVFGRYFFENNPPPLVINPVAYVSLIGFDIVAFIWSWFLLVEGSIVANGFTRKKSIWLTLSVMALTALGALVLRFV